MLTCGQFGSLPLAKSSRLTDICDRGLDDQTDIASVTSGGEIDAYVVRILRKIGATEAKFMISPCPLFSSINTITTAIMPSNKSNVTATATPSGGFSSIASDGFAIHQFAMHAMEQLGAASVVI
ncbi:hypothetical protein FPHYL_527 [Fusarium phyllophilum]|uniref:Uncharacterized protein n=1 Tax=Fusarium phyllophilum TaxID=47803 RepID=A0A8H5KG31_9HYPO|nr:hypothetical protein FPHYL_527 [Fusarium phyllophilum]